MYKTKCSWVNIGIKMNIEKNAAARGVFPFQIFLLPTATSTFSHSDKWYLASTQNSHRRNAFQMEVSNNVGGMSKFATGPFSSPLSPSFSFVPNAFSRSFSSFSLTFLLFSCFEVLASARSATRSVAKKPAEIYDRVALRDMLLVRLASWTSVD